MTSWRKAGGTGGYYLSDTLAAVIYIWRSAKAGALLGLPGARKLLVSGADAARIPRIPPCILIPAALAILQCPRTGHGYSEVP